MTLLYASSKRSVGKYSILTSLMPVMACCSTKRFQICSASASKHGHPQSKYFRPLAVMAADNVKRPDGRTNTSSLAFNTESDEISIPPRRLPDPPAF